MVAYWDQPEANVSIDTTVFGTFEASGNAGYSSAINSTIICWGATTDTTWLKEEAEPNLIFHGTADPVIPYTSGYNTDGVYLYGGKSIYDAGIDYGIETYLHPFYGAGHGVPKNSPQFDTIFMITTDFMFNHLPADIGSLCDVAVNSPMVRSSNMALKIYPNPSYGKVFIETELLVINQATINLYNTSGQLIQSFSIANFGKEISELNFSSLKSGIYFLQFITEESTVVKQLIIQRP
ncbi:MAG: T9SS type A sorting domain-containing protein, partial [Chitinophagales bacterium]|nr:T9SS type A sorting domain-containing protein [Chitinophagales bacterium]